MRSDRQPKRVEAAKQNQHISGTREWRERCERNGGAVLQGEDALTLEEVQALVDEYAGTGEMRVTKADPPQVKETVTVKGRIIGVLRDLAGNSSETDSFTIHYSKRGRAHRPSNPIVEGVGVITDYQEACRVLLRRRCGTVRTKDGRVYSGPLIDIESKWDDPRGVGCIAIKTCEAGGYDIYADEFECLLEDGEEG